MEKLLTFLTITFCGINAVAIDNAGSSRIIGGTNTSFSQFPHSVSLQELSLLETPSRGHKCGGTLFTLKHVLTSALCTYILEYGSYRPIAPSEHRIFSGTTLLSDDNSTNYIRSIANITVHPGYTPPSLTDNIAVITLSAEFLSTTVTPLALPADSLVPADAAICQVASWGPRDDTETFSNTLHSANKIVLNQIACSAMNLTNPLTDAMMCTTAVTAGCVQDEGIALVCNGNFAGVMFHTGSCLPVFPDLYTRVPRYVSWIRTVSGSSTFRPESTFIGILTIAIAKFISKM